MTLSKLRNTHFKNFFLSRFRIYTLDSGKMQKFIKKYRQKKRFQEISSPSVPARNPNFHLILGTQETFNFVNKLNEYDLLKIFIEIVLLYKQVSLDNT